VDISGSTNGNRLPQNGLPDGEWSISGQANIKQNHKPHHFFIEKPEDEKARRFEANCRKTGWLNPGLV
jgi:hypothetical protein